LLEKHRVKKNGMRDKWRHMHENVDDLKKLDRAYEMALRILREYSPTEICEIDTNEMSRNEVAERVAEKIKNAYYNSKNVRLEKTGMTQAGYEENPDVLDSKIEKIKKAGFTVLDYLGEDGKILLIISPDSEKARETRREMSDHDLGY